MEVNECSNISVCPREGSGHQSGKPLSLTALYVIFYILTLGLHMCLHYTLFSKSEDAKGSVLPRITGGKAKILIVFSHLPKKAMLLVLFSSLWLTSPL